MLQKGKQLEAAVAGTGEADDSFKLRDNGESVLTYIIEKDLAAVLVGDTILTVNPEITSGGSATFSFNVPTSIMVCRHIYRYCDFCCIGGNGQLKEIVCNELLEYFADISKVKYYENNEFFWLQYVMACMDMKEYGLAENNFRLAHQYEKEKSVESYQIKVQYGRFLLEKALAEGNEKIPIRVLKKVTDEWKKVFQNDETQKFYVYRQIYQYGQFLDEYAPQFNEEDYNKAIKLIETLTKTIRKCDKNDHRKSSREEALGILNKSAAKLLTAVVK